MSIRDFPTSAFVAGLSCLFFSCEREAGPVDPGASSPSDPVASVVPQIDPADHLGFAVHVPSDADFFVLGKDGDRMVESLASGLFATGFAITETIEIQADGDGGNELRTVPEAEVSDEEGAAPSEAFQDEIAEAAKYVGDEAFFFVSGGIGFQLETLATMYRDLSATTTGGIFGLLSEGLAGDRPFDELEPESMDTALLEKMLSQLLDVMEKDSSLQFPAVVMGWKPDPEKHQEILAALEKAFIEEIDEKSSMKPIEFEHLGILMKGSQGDGSEVFKEAVDESKEKFEGDEEVDELFESISEERIDQFQQALEDFDYTMAFGTHEGYVILYFGNGEEGFRLASTPEDSLANRQELKWTAPFLEEDIVSFAYASEALMRAGLPLIDHSPTWEAIGASIDPEIPNFREASRMLQLMADIEGDLARRDVSAWSGLMLRDEGLRIETQGGWANPDIDYEAPLKLAAAADAASPAIRMHWAQNRERRDLSWRRIELFGTVIEQGFNHFLETGGAESWGDQRETVTFFSDQLRRLNRAYRDDFRGGLGDEVGLICDFEGMTPPLPGLTEEVVEEMKLPRFVLARPVTDPNRLEASGETFVSVWKESIHEANERFDWKLPPLVPQRIESNELTTHYFPLGVTGGDFIPGISLNERVWMISTSRSMADGFSKAIGGGGSSVAPTGMIVEIDLQAIGQWASETGRLAMKGSSLGIFDPLAGLESELPAESTREVKHWLKRLQSYRYHHRMESGSPRTTHHLAITPAP